MLFQTGVCEFFELLASLAALAVLSWNTVPSDSDWLYVSTHLAQVTLLTGFFPIQAGYSKTL